MSEQVERMRQETRDAVRHITFGRPEALHAFTVDEYTELTEALAGAAQDPEARVVVLTGTGRAFSAGADRSLVDGSASATELARAGDVFDAFLETLTRFPKPVFAAVNGLAVGIGATMLLHCDLVVMAESARLRFPFTALGLVPEAGSSALLPALTRRPDAVWAMLSSEWIDATTAHAMGLAWQVVPDDELLRVVHAAAVTLAALDPAAVAATKRLVTSARTDRFRDAHVRELAEMAALRERGTNHR
jgi:enoyl-CoA hydratase/carnithine racemase